MASVTFDRATCLFPGSDRPAVDSLQLEIEDGEFLVLVGPSGCGKSTSLRMLAGLEHVHGGRILIGETDVTSKEPKDRDIAMVFQNYALYPHMSVAENMGFALQLAKHSKSEIRERVENVAKMLDLEPYLDRKPKALSGGQRQRVAMGRAIVREPQVFLMDEPLSNLDAKLRVQTRAQIAQLQRRLGTTTVYVTHDQVEAMTMGDRVAVLKDGLLQQCASPRELYNHPTNLFVAGFMGSPSMNLFTLPLGYDGVMVGGESIPLPRGLQTLNESEIVVGIRPEHLEIIGAGWGNPGEPGIAVEVDVVEELGSDAFLYGRATIAGTVQEIVARADWRRPPSKGDVVRLHVDPAQVHLFSTVDGRRLS
ncbi:MAG: sn-glycerol-3-phosphate ABC transporter ATP-binding protein UgpC [Rhodococcus sp.]|nr:sn-glycerol-3-phosphate ABC transporter ATP-binding protein UgpC [Rhodococcus sp. (in: high G+C Gram-positive bacteria)]